MSSFFKSTGFKLLAVIVASLLVGSIFAAATYNKESPLTNVVTFVFKPVQRLSSLVSEKISGVSVWFKSSAYLSEEVERLEGELNDARGKLADYDDLKKKLSLYEVFLGVKEENPDFQFVSASIIAKDAADRFGSVTLNKGTMDGVKVNDPVIYENNLVGLVTSATATQCTVDTILNPKVNVSAYDTASTEARYIQTDAQLSEKGLCRFSGLEKTTSVSPGGIICTSGTGGIYPRGLLIGEVREVVDDKETISSYAIVEPYVDFGELSDVFVITHFDGQQSGLDEESTQK